MRGMRSLPAVSAAIVLTIRYVLQAVTMASRVHLIRTVMTDVDPNV